MPTLKIGIVLFLLSVELILYYFVGGLTSYFMRVITFVFLLFWYYSSRKPLINLTDKLFLTYLFFPIITPIPLFFFNTELGKILELIMVTISYLFIIRGFQIEGSKITLTDRQNTFFMVFVPYIIIPCAFFAVVIFPLTNLSINIVTGIYLLILVYMVVLSAFLPFSERSKLYLSLSMGFILLSSGVNAYPMFIAHFDFDYGLVRILTTMFRLFLLLGMLHRADHKIKSVFSD